jgi:hypothetical protein
VTVPVLVVQGTRDPFGTPPASERRTVVQVAGDHSLRTDVDAVSHAARGWLLGIVTGGLGSAARLREHRDRAGSG